MPKLVHTGHEGEIENVLTALETEGQPLITSDSGRLTIELITAIYKAGFTQQTVELPVTCEDEYYTVQGIQRNAIHFYEKMVRVEKLGSEQGFTVGSDYQSR